MLDRRAFDRPVWPIYATKRTKRGVHILKRLVRATRLQQQWAKQGHGTRRIHDRAQDVGYVLNSGVFYSSQARLSALVPIGGDAGTPDTRRNHVTIVRNQRLRGLLPHPVLP